MAVPEWGHLNRYPEMRILLPNMASFIGILHDTQEYYYAFTFTSTIDSTSEYFRFLDAAAPTAQWRQIASDDTSRTLVRKDFQGSDEVGYIEYAPLKRGYLFLGMSLDAWDDAEWRSRYAEKIRRATGVDWKAFQVSSERAAR